MIRKIVLVMAILSIATAATAQIAGQVRVRLPEGASLVQSEEISGTLTGNGITCTWVNNANSATINFVGNYTPGFGNPKIDVAWLNTVATTPMNVTTTVTTTGSYAFTAPYQPVGGVWSSIHGESGMTENWTWGTNFPACDRMDVTFEMLEPGVDYDVTIAIEWGAGVPVDVNTWGDIKALYR